MFLALIENIYIYINVIINLKNSQNSKAYMIIETIDKVSVWNK